MRSFGLSTVVATIFASSLVACIPGTTPNPTDPGPTVTHPGGTVGAETWAKGTYVLENSLSVKGGTLVVEACSTIKMPPGATISVSDGGALKMIGTANCPITVTSSKAGQGRGDWGYIEFLASSDNNNNVFDYVIVEYAGGDGYGSLWIANDASLAMSNSTVRESGHFGVQLQNGGHLRDFSGNQLRQSTKGAMQIGANSVGDLKTGEYNDNDIKGIFVVAETVDHDATWGNWGAPYVAESGFGMNADSGSAVVTVAAGGTIALGPSANISVRAHGGLTLAGTEAEPVTIRSNKESPARGDWSYIEFFEDSVDAANSFEHAVIQHGGGGSYGSVWIANGASLKVKDTKIADSGHLGLQVVAGGELRDFTGNTLTNCARGPMVIPPDIAHNIGPGTYSPNDVEGIQLLQGAVTQTGTWNHHGVPYVAENGFSVETSVGNATLTLAPNVTLALGPSATVSVRDNGALALAGTAAQHVKITSAKAVGAPGDWEEIDIHAASNNANLWSYADISFGGGSSYGQLWVEAGASVTLDNVTFSNAGNGCDVDGTVSESSSVFIPCP